MSVSGQDIPGERPDVDGRAAVFVPSASIKDEILQTIRPGAAVVGFANHDDTLTLYFESNRFDDPALVKWEHKARKAYDRLVGNAPTVSKLVANPANFEQIGYINGKAITLRRMDVLKNWLAKSGASNSGPDSDVIKRSIVPAVKVEVGKV